jgi:hypothetical protein
MCGVGLSNMVTLSRVKFKERQSPWALSSQPVNEDSQAREVAVNPPTSAKELNRDNLLRRLMTKFALYAG